VGLLANGIAMLGSAEEDTSLARALSQLADVVERVDHVYMDQSNADFFILTEFIRDHVGLVHAIKVGALQAVSLVFRTSIQSVNLTECSKMGVQLMEGQQHGVINSVVTIYCFAVTTYCFTLQRYKTEKMKVLRGLSSIKFFKS
jgi:hypothetical protein